jgi:hypothetical protein
MYLTKKAEHLNTHERFISLYLDEIYVKPKITYTSGQIVGLADNTNNFEAATTIQAFRFKSILSKNKDI